MNETKTNTNSATQTAATKVVVCTSVYRRNHGAEPRGRGSWAFVMGAENYTNCDERDAEGRLVLFWPRDASGSSSMLFAAARKLAIAEAKRRGVMLVAVCS